ncbi:MAG: FkbM family methyltransferase [candidate division KSB1 bacterium]|nr:FkbM family methyltransferase [candidate division KSB1 bacterium]
MTKLLYLARRLGIRGAFVFLFKEKFFRAFSRAVGRRVDSSSYYLYSPESQFPLLCRTRSSDRQVFGQIFIDREYGGLDHLRQPRFILDCGANVGYAAAFFLTQFPRANVLAVEPDERNFAVLQRNLAPYGNRAQALLSAVWSHQTGLKVCRGQYGDGQEWATQVRPCLEGEGPDVVAADIGALLSSSGFDRIDILKMDVEGAEAVVFSSNYESWIDKVDCFMIELHDERCRQAFFHALEGRAFTFSRSGELTVAQRLGW